MQRAKHFDHMIIFKKEIATQHGSYKTFFVLLGSY